MRREEERKREEEEKKGGEERKREEGMVGGSWGSGENLVCKRPSLKAEN